MDELVLERPGCAVHAWLAGPTSGLPLVMLHGAGVDHRTFDPQLEAFSRGYRLAVPDLRGHGRSRPNARPFSLAEATDDVFALLEHLGGPVILLGQSMGGNIAQEIVFQAPSRVSALVAVDCVCNTLPLSAAQRALLAVSPALLRLLPQQLLWSSTVALTKRVDVRAYLSATVRQLSKAELLEITTATLRALHPEPGYRIRCPLLIVRGEHDTAGAIRQQAPVWARRDAAGYAIIPDAGHLSNMDNPLVFNQRVMDFLERVAALKVKPSNGSSGNHD
jgi:pimeloyl-ACP methyl ester carboxylesterase